MKRIVFILMFMPFICFGQLLINEFSSRGGYGDKDGNDCDWVEIINSGSDEINLSDYFISDDLTQSIVFIGEIGGIKEQEAAEFLKSVNNWGLA